jgi:hypothetical protein
MPHELEIVLQHALGALDKALDEVNHIAVENAALAAALAAALLKLSNAPALHPKCVKCETLSRCRDEARAALAGAPTSHPFNPNPMGGAGGVKPYTGPGPIGVASGVDNRLGRARAARGKKGEKS